METEVLDLKSLSSRIARLETQNRRLKCGAAVLGLFVAALVLMGQAPSHHTLRADEFVLQDETGNARAKLSLEAGGRPTLSFLDEHGGILVSLAGGEEPFLVLKRPGSNEQVQLAANKYSYGLALYDAHSHRAGLSVQQGVPTLDLFDQEGRNRASMQASATGPAFNLRDSDGKAGIVLKVAPQGAGPSLVFFDKDGKVLSSAPSGPVLEASQPK